MLWFICANREPSSSLCPTPCPKQSFYLCFFTISVYLWRKGRRKVSIFHKIGQFTFQVKSGSVTRKSFEKRKVLGISCFFSDNEFRKDDLPPNQAFKKKCLPTLLFSNPNWYDNIQEVNIWKWVLKKKTTHTQKTIFLPSKCNFKFQRQDLGQWFGSFFILPKLGHPSLIVQSRGIRKMAGNKNPKRKEKAGIHSAQSCMPLSSADFSRICTLVTKGSVWSTDFIIIEEEIFLTVKWKNIIYDADSGSQAEQETEAYLPVAFRTEIGKWGEARSTHRKWRVAQVHSDLAASGAP